MADLTITAAEVRAVLYDRTTQRTAPAGEAINAGQYCRLNTSTGKFELGNATTATEVGGVGFIAGRTVTTGEALTAYLAGSVVDVGDAIDGLNFDAPVYLSDTDGTLSTTAGTVSTVVGRVTCGWASTSADKLLQLVKE